MQVDRKQLMQTAWESARRRADFHGTTVRSEFGLALKHAWADARKSAAKVAAPVVAAPVAAAPTLTLAERTWAPQLARIAAREAAGIADDMDASIRLLAAQSIADHARLAAHLSRATALAARFA